MKKALILLAALMVSACAWTEDTVAIPRPSISVAAVPGAERISVTVVSADARQELEVSHKKNGYGMRGASIRAANDVVAEIRAGVVDVLRGQGFREGPGGASVRVEVSRFYNNFDMGFFSATANAQAVASVTVTSADGRALYARVYNGSHLMPGVQLMSGDNAAAALREAMTVLLRQIADDPQLTRALTQAGTDYVPGVPGRDPNVRS